MLHIGIDTGVKTGFAVWDDDSQKFRKIETMTITKALQWVVNLKNNNEITLYFEDARLRKWVGNTGRERLQGAGSIKRDAKIWEDFCEEQGIRYQAVAPKNNLTKLTPATFKAITNWQKTTSEHSRDAAMLVFERKGL